MAEYWEVLDAEGNKTGRRMRAVGPWQRGSTT